MKAGVNRLQEMQLSDGGWGWFSGWGEQSTAHTTATVVHGLQVAKQNDVALVPGVLERGVEWLKQHQEEQLRRLANVDDAGKVIDKSKPSKRYADNIDALVYMVLVDADVKSDTMRDRLYKDRTNLAVYALTNYGLALNKQHETEKLAMIMRNISQYIVQDNEDQTAYLNLPQNIWWYWYGSEFEANAYYLKLLAAVEPKNPVAPRLVGHDTSSTTASTHPTGTARVTRAARHRSDGGLHQSHRRRQAGSHRRGLGRWPKAAKRPRIDADNLFTFDNAFVLEGEAFTPGRHTIEVRK